MMIIMIIAYDGYDLKKIGWLVCCIQYSFSGLSWLQEFDRLFFFLVSCGHGYRHFVSILSLTPFCFLSKENRLHFFDLLASKTLYFLSDCKVSLGLLLGMLVFLNCM